MNTFVRFLFRISPKKGLKMDYFARKSSKSPTAGGFTPNPRFDSMTREWAKTLLPLNIFGWCRCLAIFRAKRIFLYFMFSGSAPSLPKIPWFGSWGDWYLSTLQTNLAYKKLEYCSLHNVLHYECYYCQAKIFSQFYLLILFKV